MAGLGGFTGYGGGVTNVNGMTPGQVRLTPGNADEVYPFTIGLHELIPRTDVLRNPALPTSLAQVAPPPGMVPMNIGGSGIQHSIPTKGVANPIMNARFHFLQVLREVFDGVKVRMLQIIAPIVPLAPGQTSITFGVVRIKPALFRKTTEFVPPPVLSVEWSARTAGVGLYHLGVNSEALFDASGNFASTLAQLFLEQMYVAQLNTLVYRLAEMLVMSPVAYQAYVNTHTPPTISDRAAVFNFVYIASRDPLGMQKLIEAARSFYIGMGVAREVPMWLLTAANVLREHLIRQREFAYRRGMLSFPVAPGVGLTDETGRPIERATAYMFASNGTTSAPYYGSTDVMCFGLAPLAQLTPDREHSSYTQISGSALDPFTGRYATAEVYPWDDVQQMLHSTNADDARPGDALVSIYSNHLRDWYPIRLSDALREQAKLAGTTEGRGPMKTFIDAYIAHDYAKINELAARYGPRRALRLLREAQVPRHVTWQKYGNGATEQVTATMQQYYLLASLFNRPSNVDRAAPAFAVPPAITDANVATFASEIERHDVYTLVNTLSGGALSEFRALAERLRAHCKVQAANAAAARPMGVYAAARGRFTGAGAGGNPENVASNYEASERDIDLIGAYVMYACGVNADVPAGAIPRAYAGYLDNRTAAEAITAAAPPTEALANRSFEVLQRPPLGGAVVPGAAVAALLRVIVPVHFLCGGTIRFGPAGAYDPDLAGGTVAQVTAAVRIGQVAEFATQLDALFVRINSAYAAIRAATMFRQRAGFSVLRSIATACAVPHVDVTGASVTGAAAAAAAPAPAAAVPAEPLFGYHTGYWVTQALRVAPLTHDAVLDCLAACFANGAAAIDPYLLGFYAFAVAQGHVVPYWLPVAFRPAIVHRAISVAFGVSGGTPESQTAVTFLGPFQTAVGRDAGRFYTLRHARYEGACVQLGGPTQALVMPAVIAAGHLIGGNHLPIRSAQIKALLSPSDRQGLAALENSASVLYPPMPLSFLTNETATRYPMPMSGKVPAYMAINTSSNVFEVNPIAPWLNAFNAADAAAAAAAATAATLTNDGVQRGILGGFVFPGARQVGYVIDGRNEFKRTLPGHGPLAGMSPQTAGRWETGICDPGTTRMYQDEVAVTAY